MSEIRKPPSGSGPMAVFAAIAVLLLIGMLFGASLLLLAGVSIGLLVLINRYLVTLWSGSTIATRLTGDQEVKVGATADIQIELTNPTKIPTLWLLAEDLAPKQILTPDAPALQIVGERLGVMLLWPGESKHLSYQVKCHRRGYLQMGPTVIETGDLMGLFRRFRVGTPPQFITVLPEVIPLSEYEIGSRRPIGEIKMRENVMADPTRLRGIRQWQVGDPMRSVHWAATARTGTLHSKVYEPSSIIGATIVLDMHCTSNPDRNEPHRSELAVTAAASIASALHQASEPFGLASNGRDAADRIRTEGWVGDHRVRADASSASAMTVDNDRLRPVLLKAQRGPVAFQELHRTLARLERTDGLTFDELLVESESAVSSETTQLVILQTATPAIIAAITSLARRGRAVAVIINTHGISDFTTLAGPLIASRIPAFHLANRDSIAGICREWLASR